jgi:SAM-dependent methyltransferase
MLGEIHRVLRPGGRFVFFEHVGDRPGSFRRMVQNTVKYTPWTYFSDGCRPDRAIGTAIDDAGFSSVEYDSYMHEGLGVIGEITKPHVCGIAIR